MKKICLLVLSALAPAMLMNGQSNPKSDYPPECVPRILKRGRLTRPFKFLSNEKCRGSPVLQFEIHEDGTVSNAKLTRSSGVADIDRQSLNSVVHTRFAPRKQGCGVVDSEMTLTIHWGLD